MGATGVVPPVHLTPCPWGFVLALNHRLLHLGRAVGIGQVQQREVPRRPLDQRADGGLCSPGGVSGQSEPVEPGVADEAPGDREQAQPKAFGFPPPGWVIGEGQHLQPGGELDGERNDGQPEPVLGVAVQRQVGQPGVFADADAVLAAGGAPTTATRASPWPPATSSSSGKRNRNPRRTEVPGMKPSSIVQRCSAWRSPSRARGLASFVSLYRQVPSL